MKMPTGRPAYPYSDGSKLRAPLRVATAFGWMRKRSSSGAGCAPTRKASPQLSAILKPHDVVVVSYDLPLWQGEEACLHLMSVMSPLSRDLALVFSPLLPASFYRLLNERCITLIDAPADEFHAQQRPQSQRSACATEGGDHGGRFP